jgi:hypothetical protein
VQATVASFDAQTRTGTVLLDDGTELAFDRDAFDQSGLRLLRFGQRLRIVPDSERRIVEISLITMG